MRGIALLALALLTTMPAAAQEIRGLWVSRFEWPQSTQSATQSRIQTILNRMQSGKFNAVFFQVRGQGETFYPSPEEPWAQYYNFKSPGYDPLAYAIEQAHARSIQFHAYFNTHVCWQSSTKSPPPHTTPEHMFWLHCNGSDPARRDWLFHDSTGTPQSYGEDNYVWISQGVPDFQAFIRRQVVYLAKNYNVDGIHFDRVRVAGTGSYDPISVSRFQGSGNPKGLGYQDWTRDQLTRTLIDIYGAVAEVNATRPPGKPYVALSTAPIFSQSRAYNYNQDVVQWLASGANDFACPQLYYSNTTDFRTALLSYTNKDLGGRYIVAGMHKDIAAEKLRTIFDFIGITRESSLSAKCAGQVVFSYTKYSAGPPDELAIYANGDTAQGLSAPYAQAAPPRSFPWVTQPAEAILVGTVRNPFGYPVVDAWMYRSDRADYVGLSSGDGFYTFLRVAVGGTLTITCQKTGVGADTKTLTDLKAGEVRRVDFTIPPPPPTPTPTPSPSPSPSPTPSLTPTPSPSPSPSSSPTPVANPARGDINADGNVDAQDLEILTRGLVGRWPPMHPLEADRADLNGDDVVDVADWILEAALTNNP
jgi:uncharacterized lipoprotein YddW (UPF0748 family)